MANHRIQVIVYGENIGLLIVILKLGVLQGIVRIYLSVVISQKIILGIKGVVAGSLSKENPLIFRKV